MKYLLAHVASSTNLLLQEYIHRDFWTNLDKHFFLLRDKSELSSRNMYNSDKFASNNSYNMLILCFSVLFVVIGKIICNRFCELMRKLA